MFQVPLFYAQQEVDSSDQKREEKANTDVLLDPNHTHFIFVDDGSEGQFGKEIEFRAHLEAELRRGKSLKYYENKRIRRKCLYEQCVSPHWYVVTNRDYADMFETNLLRCSCWVSLAFVFTFGML